MLTENTTEHRATNVFRSHVRIALRLRSGNDFQILSQCCTQRVHTTFNYTVHNLMLHIKFNMKIIRKIVCIVKLGPTSLHLIRAD
jgi:hypothetical protein